MSLGIAFAPLHVVAAPAAAAAAPASAPPATDDRASNLKRAEELFRNGGRLYQEGSYEAAILAFQESYELSKEPQLLYNIGNAYERLGDFANARRYLDQYRAYAPENERESLSRRIQALDQRQREKEQKEREAAATTPTEPKPTDTPQVTTPPPVQDEKPKKDPVFGPAAIALTAGVVVGLGLGVGFGIKASGEKKQALEGCMDLDGGARFCSEASQNALDKRKTSALVADIGFAVAGAAAIGLITVLALKATRKRSSERAQLAPFANPRGGGLVFNLRF